MRVKNDDVIFSTRKTVYANNGIIGLSEPSKDGWHISEGYDGGIYVNELTKEERIELADYMIGLWQRMTKPMSFNWKTHSKNTWLCSESR